jgi:hypothetical protein
MQVKEEKASNTEPPNISNSMEIVSDSEQEAELEEGEILSCDPLSSRRAYLEYQAFIIIEKTDPDFLKVKPTFLPVLPSQHAPPTSPANPFIRSLEKVYTIAKSSSAAVIGDLRFELNSEEILEIEKGKSSIPSNFNTMCVKFIILGVGSIEH